MFNSIETLRMASALTGHAAERQKLIARNVANADTPGYRARDLHSFDDSYRNGPGIGLRTTRADHMATPASSWGMGGNRSLDLQSEPAPNGNTVSVEDEMLRVADTRREFDLSLAITKSSLGLIRTSLGRRG